MADKSAEQPKKVGGARPGAGRRPGSKNVRKAKYAEAALAHGVTPIDVMLGTMRGLWGQAIDGEGKIVKLEMAERACAVAKDAAPFCHPRLNAVDMTGSLDVRNMSDEALDARIRQLAAEAGVAGAS